MTGLDTMLGMKFTAVLFLSLVMTETVGAKQYKFAVVPKEENNPFFQASREGCEALRDPLINPPVHSHLLRAAQL